MHSATVAVPDARPAGLPRVFAAAILALVAAGGWWELSRQIPQANRLRYPRCQATTYPTQVQDCWRDVGRSVFRVRNAHAAHRSLVADIEISDLGEAGMVARGLVPALPIPLDEAMFYFRRADPDDRRVRIRWTPAKGYEELEY